MRVDGWIELVCAWAGVEYQWGAGAPMSAMRGLLQQRREGVARTQTELERCARAYRPERLDCGGLVGEGYAVGSLVGALDLADPKDRGAVAAPNAQLRSLGGWLWEAAPIGWIDGAAGGCPPGARPGDLVGWRGRRHVGLVVQVHGDGDVTIVEAVGSQTIPGLVRVRRERGAAAERMYPARPFAHIVAEWEDGRPVPRRARPDELAPGERERVIWTQP